MHIRHAATRTVATRVGMLSVESRARAIWIGAAWGGHIGVLAAHRHRDRLSAWSYTGADDALFPVEEARRQSARISACRFAVVPHSAHQSALESPREVNPLVRSTIEAWLAR